MAGQDNSFTGRLQPIAGPVSPIGSHTILPINQIAVNHESADLFMLDDLPGIQKVYFVCFDTENCRLYEELLTDS